jgi:hypothetical protein
VHEVVFGCEKNEIPPLACREANVVIGEQAGKQRSSREQLPLEIEDWAVVDPWACLAEEPDSKYRPRLPQSAQFRHDQPMRPARIRPSPASEARADP